jgi:3-methyladenine DNA glycosylase/8-oxoguanine DNA glycosylase
MNGHTAKEIVAAQHFLAKKDRALPPADKVTPPFDWRTRDRGSSGLLQLVLEQQVSTASAAAIWARVKNGFSTLTPSVVLAKGQAYLRHSDYPVRKHDISAQSRRPCSPEPWISIGFASSTTKTLQPA